MKLYDEALLQDKDLDNNYSVVLANAFTILGDLPYDEEVVWFAVHDTIVSTAGSPPIIVWTGTVNPGQEEDGTYERR